MVYADSHETTGEAAQAGLVMDNQPTTYWHTKWQGDNPSHPHMIVLDLGKVQKLSGFRYLPRQDRETAVSRTMKSMRLPSRSNLPSKIL